MSGFNNSLRFYKTYYNCIRWEASDDDKENIKKFEAVNRELCESVFPAKEELSFGYNLSKEHSFELSTVYPGLLLGSGISHGSGRQGEFKLGFFFDHTTGLPVIPGSSVKGTLRSVFPLGLLHEAKKAKGEDKSRLEAKAAQVTEYLKLQLQEISKQAWEDPEIQQFETWLFGSYESGKAVGPMSGRVIFHDAIPVSVDMVRLNGKNTKQYLASDFITPHKNRKKDGIPDQLKNPVPIQFLKILSGVEFRFQFVLFPYQVKEKTILTVHNIRDLFKALLLQFGVGAKTNVGYGQFVEPTDYQQQFGGGNAPDNGQAVSRRGTGSQSAQPPIGRESRGNTNPPPPPPPPPNPLDALDFKALESGIFYARVLPGKADKKKLNGEFQRLEVFKDRQNPYNPFRAKDGSLQNYAPETILKVRIVAHDTNLQDIVSFEIVELVSSPPPKTTA